MMNRVVTVLALLVLAGCAGSTGSSAPKAIHTHRPHHSPSASPSATGSSAPGKGCRPVQVGSDPTMVLPDASCTPGATNPAVTQANLASTVCKSGYTAAIRPPLAYTSQVKQMEVSGTGGTVSYQGRTYTVPGYTLSDRSEASYELDHLIPLELGGAPADPRNLWPEFNYPNGPHPTSYDHNPKDPIEFKLRGELCSGKIALAQAQQEIASNWTKL